MGRPKIVFDPKVLRELYINQQLTPVEIGKRLGCTFGTIRTRLLEYKIPLRSPAVARMRYEKFPFSGNVLEKAYLLGFTIGDLNVYVPGRSSATIVARCHTTQPDQVEVIKSCFSKYGQITVSISRNIPHLTVNAFLDAGSFNFLLEKYSPQIPSWIRGEAKWAFIGGYNDAEGNLLLNQNRARLKIDSYDQHVLSWIQQYLISQKIDCRLRCIAKRGQMQKVGYFNRDLWRLNVNKGRSLERLINILLPFTRHKKRKADMMLCLQNIQTRIQNRTI